MANAVYPIGREGFALGEIDWDTAVFKCYLVRGYTYSASHKFFSEVLSAGGTLVSTSAALASKTATAGVLDAADTTFVAVPSGAAIGAVIIAQASAVGGGADVADAAKRLVVFIDTATGLPTTPIGTDIPLTFDNGANKIAAI